MNTANTQTRKILLVDEIGPSRLALHRLLQSGDSQVPVQDAHSLAEALLTYRYQGPFDLVLMDMSIADRRGLQGLRQFFHHHPNARVAVLGSTSDNVLEQQARAAGARAYLAKGRPPHLLAQDVQRLLNEVEGKAQGATQICVRRAAPQRARVAELGPRHVEVLDHVLFGRSNQQICHATGLSLTSVKYHVSTILLAMDATSRSQLISAFR